MTNLSGQVAVITGSTSGIGRALARGCEPEFVASLALFAGISEIVDVYGEESVADFAKSLPERLHTGEFSLAHGEIH